MTSLRWLAFPPLAVSSAKARTHRWQFARSHCSTASCRHTLNEPWFFLLSMSAWLGFCTWACAHFTNNVAYAFQLAGYTAAIIAFPMVNITEPASLWDIASGACLRGDSRYFVRRHDDDDPAEQFRCYSPFNRIEKHARPITGTCQFTLAA